MDDLTKYVDEKCPFCGSSYEIEEISEGFYVDCSNGGCVLHRVYPTEEEALNSWKERKVNHVTGN